MAIPVTVPKIFKSRMEANPDVVAQAYKTASGEFAYRTYAQLYADMLDLAESLREIGVQRGDHVGLISDNRREWLISDLAVQCLGAADVPRGCDSMEREIAFILSSTDCRLAFVENKSQLAKILKERDSLPLLERLVMFNEPTEEDFAFARDRGVALSPFSALLAEGSAARASDASKTALLEAELERGVGSEIATLIFTSGTTGDPKGVILTHANYAWQLERTPSVLYGESGDMWLSVLPVWHSFERLMQYIAIERASGIAYSKPIASVMLPDLAKIRPQVIPGVPRLWEALAAGIFRAVKKEGGAKKALFDFFVGVGKRYADARDLMLGRVPRFTKRVRLLDALAGAVPFALLSPLRALGDLLVFRKIRMKLGGRVRSCISGGGALQSEVDAFYRAIGITMIEGYGITETAPLLSLRDQWHPKPGCIGVAFADTEVRVVDAEALSVAIESAGGAIEPRPAGALETDPVRGSWRIPERLPPGKIGVLVVRGGQVMNGYFKRPDLTARVIDADGWFNTGDLVMMSWDGDIKITGRAKDTIVLLGGENVEPAPIERAIKSFSMVESVIVLGQDKKYLAALIVPSRDAVLAYAAERDLQRDDYQALLEDPEIVQLFRTEIDARVNRQAGFRPFEFVARFTLLPESFQVGKELSGKQEMMRHRINDIYREEIGGLFAG